MSSKTDKPPVRGPVASAGVAIALIGFGLILPVGFVADWIAGHGGLTGPEIALGLWIFKGALALLGVWLWVLGAQPQESTAPSVENSGPSVLDPSDRGPVALALVGILAVALVVRLIALGDGLWIDEITTLVEFVRVPLPALVTSFDTQNNHVLYSILARASFGIFGDSVWALRLPAALLGVASVWAAYSFTLRVGDRREALLVAAALAVSYHHVWFSQNARGYTGLLLFTLLGTSAFLDIIRPRVARPKRAVVKYSAFAALGVYLHLTGLFMAVAHGLFWLVLLLRRGVGETRWVTFAMVGAGLLSLVLYAPVLPQLLGTVTEAGKVLVDTEWQSLGWMIAETARGLARGLPGGWLGLGAGAAVGVVGVVSFARRTPAALGLMLLPGLVCTVILLATSHNLWPRFYFFLAGFFVLLGVRGVRATSIHLAGRHGERVALVLLLVGILVSSLLVPRAWGPKQDFAGAVAFIDEVSVSGDVVASAGLASYPLSRMYAPEWPAVADVAELESIERGARSVRILMIIPVEMEASRPELLNHLMTFYTEEARFPGTVAGGEVIILRREVGP